MELLDLRRIESSTLQTSPFPWAHIKGALSARDLAHLTAVVPSEKFNPVASVDPAKPYAMAVLPLRERNGAVPVAQAAWAKGAWCALCDAFSGTAYRVALEGLTGMCLRNAGVEICLWRYGAGSFLAPHTDKPDKLLTHIFYLTDDWQPRWGGRLLLLHGQQVGDVAHAVPPLSGSSVVLVRTDSSWHAVETVSADAPRQRMSLQVVLWNAHTEKNRGPALNSACGSANR